MSDAPQGNPTLEQLARQAAVEGSALFSQGRLSEARDKYEYAVQMRPGQPELHLNLALVLEAMEEWQMAWDVCGPAMNSAALADRAAALYARLAPKLGRELDALRQMHAPLQRPPLDLTCRRQLHFAAATLLDRVGRYDEAFHQARAAHAIRRPVYDPSDRAVQFDVRLVHWTSQRVQALTRATHRNRRPVFIVGMPRSGTSLVEQILSCHPQVYAAGETGGLGRMASMLDASGAIYPQSLESLTQDGADRLAETYLNSIQSMDPQATYVTDKMPMNFMYLDLVQVLLPDSHVIHCVRDPQDTCLSCYTTDFATAYDFASDLKTLGDFYRLYSRLTDHWKRVLTLPILDVRYENVVEDLEGQSRRILDFLDLPWDPRCLRFYENQRPVNTASSDQVRRPIYKSSVGRWKNYEKHLGELLAALTPSTGR